MKTISKIQIFQYVALLTILIICFFSYINGLNSPFLFDDIPNMETIGKYSYLGNWNDFFLYILSGDSSPLGRPLSLASFYINDNSWNGMSRIDFKYTNLLIHLINGLLVYLLVYKISTISNNKKIIWLPILVTSFWLLNPIHVNTILYAVQRMTELAAFFTLSSILFYIYAFEKKEKLPPLLGLLTLSILSFILGILSKETAILTPIFILIIEKTFLKNNIKSIDTVLKFYLILILIALIYFGWFNTSNRTFTVNERLLTESRILLNYVKSILMPSIYGDTLLHDDFEKSTSLVEPFSTLPTILVEIFFLIFALNIRKKLPFISFGILWFFVGHLLESTTIQLELYFDHRNYLPSLGLFVVICYGIINLDYFKLKKIIYILSFIYLLFFTFSTALTTNLWSRPIDLLSSWLIDHPYSLRTLEALNSAVGENTDIEKKQKLEENILKVSNSKYNYLYTDFLSFRFKCLTNSLTNQEIEQVQKNISSKVITIADSAMLAQFLNLWMQDKCNNIDEKELFDLLNILQSRKLSSDFLSVIYYWQAMLYFKEKNLSLTIDYLEKSYDTQKNLDNLLLQASYLATAGLYKDALAKLARTKDDLCNDWRSCMILKLRQPDIDNLKTAIQAAQQKANNNEQAVHHSTSEERS